MQRIIYAKCSVERKAEYRIITRIIEENGGRVVEKRAVGERAERHVERMADFAKSSPYLTPNVQLIPCEKTGDGSVRFPYVEGLRLDNIIDEAVKLQKWEVVWEHVTLLKNIIMDVKGIKEFWVTKDFKKVFGSIPEMEGYAAACNVSLDMVSANIILSDAVYIIDYEWTFDFPIPLKFILYRSILLNGTLNVIPEDKKKILMNIVDITERECELFLRMEEAFQKFVAGVSLNNLYLDMPSKSTVIREENYCGETRKSLPFRAVQKVKGFIALH